MNKTWVSILGACSLALALGAASCGGAVDETPQEEQGPRSERDDRRSDSGDDPQSDPGPAPLPRGQPDPEPEPEPEREPEPSSDVGRTCQGPAGCSNGLCVVSDGADFGYCTTECESFADCPTFWDCDAVDNGSRTYCLQR